MARAREEADVSLDDWEAKIRVLARSRAFVSIRCDPGGSTGTAAVTEFCLRTRTACSHTILSLAVILAFMALAPPAY
jgi:hypothetical protein